MQRWSRNRWWTARLVSSGLMKCFWHLYSLSWWQLSFCQIIYKGRLTSSVLRTTNILLLVVFVKIELWKSFCTTAYTVPRRPRSTVSTDKCSDLYRHRRSYLMMQSKQRQVHWMLIQWTREEKSCRCLLFLKFKNLHGWIEYFTAERLY